jgi:hypothetical protein
MEKEKKWEELTPAEKQEKRFKRWLEAPGVEFISPEAKKAYRERVTRFIKVIKLEEPDRVPLFLPAGNFPAYYAGTTLMKTMYDYDEMCRAWRKFRQDFDTDTAMGPGLVFPGKVFDRIDYKLWKWPGHGLHPDSRSYQWIESKFMMDDEYDALLEDPTNFWLRMFIPRISGALEPLKHLSPLDTISIVSTAFIAPFARPDVQSALRALMDAAEELEKWGAAVAESSREAISAGYPPSGGSWSGAPFDMIADGMRGTHGILMDMYRQPDKLLEALEKLTPIAIKLGMAGADTALSPIVGMPLHKGSDGFMSNKQFETFFWPTFRKVLIGLIDEGMVPMPFAEGAFDNRLEIIKDVPRGSMIWALELTDMARAKEVLGDTACIAGNVPTSLLATGTPQEVKEHCRKLIETCGKGGGYILAGASSVDETTAGNLRAMMEAVKEYGVYR